MKFLFIPLILLSSFAYSDEAGNGEYFVDPVDTRLTADLPEYVRKWYLNVTSPGSCVQCSLGMCGADQNVPEAATLLWDTEYGSKVWHGTGPSRAINYCRERKIKVWSITGDETYAWMKWAISTGRPCAIGAGNSHFQTLVGYDDKTKVWYVCNNNSPTRIDAYSDAAFRRLHYASGYWIMILKNPPHPLRPEYN